MLNTSRKDTKNGIGIASSYGMLIASLAEDWTTEVWRRNYAFCQFHNLNDNGSSIKNLLNDLKSTVENI